MKTGKSEDGKMRKSGNLRMRDVASSHFRIFACAVLLLFTFHLSLFTVAEAWEIVGTPSGGSSVPVDKTHAELLADIGASRLTAGQKYRITDFRTRHLIPGTTTYNNGPTEVLIVTAASESTLQPVAQSESYPQDIVFYEMVNTHNYDSVSNPQVNGTTYDRGRITRRIDTTANVDIGEDFRAMKYRRWQMFGIPASNDQFSSAGQRSIAVDFPNQYFPGNYSINGNDNNSISFGITLSAGLLSYTLNGSPIESGVGITQGVPYQLKDGANHGIGISLTFDDISDHTGGFMVLSRGWLGLSATGNYFFRQEQETAYNLLSGEYMDVPILPFDYSPTYVRNISIGAPYSGTLLDITIDGSDEYEEKLVSNVQIGTGAYQLSFGNGCNAIRLLDDVIGSSIGNGVQKLTIDSSNGSITIGDNVNTAYLQNCVDGTVIDAWAGKVYVETDSNVWAKGGTQYISARMGSAMNIAEYTSQNITFGERVSYITTSPGDTMKEYVTRDIVYSGVDGSTSDVVDGGSLTITGGAGVGTGNGGSVTLAAGTANGSGEHGDLYLRSDRAYLQSIMGSPSLSACGTGPSITGGNTLGTVTLGTGSPTSCTLTFTVAWASTPSCVITPLGNATVYISAQSATELTVTGTATFSGFNYACFGH